MYLPTWSGAEGAFTTLTNYSTTFPVYKILPQRNSETSLCAKNRQQRKLGLIVSFGESGSPLSVVAALAIVHSGLVKYVYLHYRNLQMGRGSAKNHIKH